MLLRRMIMPELLNVDNIGNKGINTDISPWSLPPDFITSGRNFRIYAGSIYASGGWEDWSTAPTLFNPGHVHHVGSTSGDFWVVLGRDKVYAFNGGDTWNDISSAAGYAGIGENDELKWTSCQLAQIPVYNNPQAHPEFWSPQDGVSLLQPLQWDSVETWDDIGFSCQVMRSHKNFLVAMDIQESATHYPNVVRISTAADINGLPFTWDENDKSGLAVRFQLGGDGGKIIDGLSQRDNFVVYSETSIDVLTFNPNSEFLWERSELSNTVGLLSTNSIIEVKGMHYFLGDGDIYANDGNTIKSILYGRIKTQFTQRVNADFYERSYAVRNDTYKEIWFCVPIDGAEYPNVAYVFNWHDDSWAVRTLPYDTDTTVSPPAVIEGLAYASYGSQSEPTQTWDEWLGTWDAQQGVWGSRKLSPLDSTVVGVVGQTSQLIILDPRTTKDSPFEAAKIERTNFPLLGHREVTTITRVYPYMRGSNKVLIEFGSQDFAGSSVRWKPGIVFDPEVDRKIDIRTTGELHCWRFTSEDIGQTGVGNWSISGMGIEYELDGVR